MNDDVIPLYGDILEYKQDITIPNTKEIKKVTLYCEPIRVNIVNSEIVEYHIVEIFNMVEYLNGDRSNTTCKDTIFSRYDIPEKLKSYIDFRSSNKL